MEIRGLRRRGWRRRQWRRRTRCSRRWRRRRWWRRRRCAGGWRSARWRRGREAWFRARRTGRGSGDTLTRCFCMLRPRVPCRGLARVDTGAYVGGKRRVSCRALREGDSGHEQLNGGENRDGRSTLLCIHGASTPTAWRANHEPSTGRREIQPTRLTHTFLSSRLSCYMSHAGVHRHGRPLGTRPAVCRSPWFYAGITAAFESSVSRNPSSSPSSPLCRTPNAPWALLSSSNSASSSDWAFHVASSSGTGAAM